LAAPAKLPVLQDWPEPWFVEQVTFVCDALFWVVEQNEVFMPEEEHSMLLLPALFPTPPYALQDPVPPTLF
jgi:hypothetical protein